MPAGDLFGRFCLVENGNGSMGGEQRHGVTLKNLQKSEVIYKTIAQKS